MREPGKMMALAAIVGWSLLLLGGVASGETGGQITVLSSGVEDRATGDSATTVASEQTESNTSPLIDVTGRISMQYYGIFYDQSVYNIAQPGVNMNLRGKVRDLPLNIEMYGSFRTLSYGGKSPFGSGAINQSRIYRLSADYDDGESIVSFGRILPGIAPTIGYLDGASYARRFGSFTVGASLGFQPDFSQQGIDTEFRKFAVFASYQTPDPFPGTVTLAYSRTHRLDVLDREVVAVGTTIYTNAGFSLYGNADIDLRSKSGNDFKLSPLLTSLFGTASYRFSSFITLSAGVIAVRPYSAWSIVGMFPDNFLDMRLRTNLLVNLSLYFPIGVSVYSNYTPRFADGAFGREYSHYHTVAVPNVLKSGVLVRGTFGMNGSEYGDVQQYGVGLQRNFFTFIDLMVRYDTQKHHSPWQQTEYTSNTLGTDILVLFSPTWSVSLSHAYTESFRLRYHSAHAELGYRL
jgi:hypothetical protein